MQLPVAYIEEMKSLLGADYAPYEASLTKESRRAIRVNTAKISVEDFKCLVTWQLIPIPWIDNGFFCDGAKDISKCPYYAAGLYYIQEASAMTPANRLMLNPGDKVLDMCAAPGGKATELGAKLLNRGVLMANDISNSRAKALLKNMELFGLANICVTSENPEKLASIYPEYFDKILIDAPCSGEGMFRRDKRMVEDWQNKGPDYYSEIQKQLIVAGATMLKSGGKLLYSTCTFSKKENEEVVTHLLRNCPQMRLISPEGYEGFAEGFDGLTDCIRIFPHKMAGDGHFIALLEKAPSSNQNASEDSCLDVERQTKSDSLPEDAVSFLQLIERDFSDGYFKIINDKIYFLNNNIEIHKSIRYLRTGLYIGLLKRNRFEPSQALAMNLKAYEFASSIDLNVADIRTIKYLKGETIDVSDCPVTNLKGWQLVCVEGYPLGFGKLANGTLKNKYYQGWRMN